MTINQLEPQNIFEVTYNYNYIGEVRTRYEHMTTKQVENIRKYITKGVSAPGSYYSFIK
jgi:hypothetical protein